MYQIIRITDKAGAAKTDSASLERVGCLGDAKMEDGCALIHCHYDRQGQPCDKYIRTSLIQSWKKNATNSRIMLETCNSIYYLEYINAKE